MIIQTAVVIIALLASTVSCGSSKPPQVQYPTQAFAAAPAAAQLTGGPEGVDVIARGFAMRKTPLPEKLGYYMYLYFGSKSESARPVRTSAAKAFLSLFNNTSNATSLGISNQRLAFLYAPVDVSKPESLPQTVEDFLAHYDYDTANLTALKLGYPLPGVAVIGGPRPPPWRAEDLRSLQIVDLCGPPADVENKILSFRNQLVFDKTTLQGRGFDIKGKVAAFFESIGAFVLTPLAKSPTAPVECH